MSKFRKKPIVVEAAQWWKNGDHPDDRVGETTPDAITGVGYTRLEGAVVRFFRHPDVPNAQAWACQHCSLPMDAHGWIDTLEGGHIVCPGDWVITGVEGERYPCKPSVFEATYEAVDA